jgi:hypothetical protein
MSNDNKIKTIYVSGQMRGIRHFNFPAFDEAESQLTKLGWDVINPAQLDREFRDFDPTLLPDSTDWSKCPPGFDLVDCIRHDIEHITTCDAIYMLPGHKKSKGATAELAVAQWLGLDVLYADPMAVLTQGPESGKYPQWQRVEPQPGSTDPRFKKTYGGQETAKRIQELEPPNLVDLCKQNQKFCDSADTAIGRGHGDPTDPASKDTNPKDAIGAMKAKFSTIPAGVMYDVGLALLEGAVKYGRHNYRGVGVRASIYYDAAVGHISDWWEGDDIDADSGLSHVTKAIASLVVLRDAMFQGKLTDDRPPASKVFKRDFNSMAAEIIGRHTDKNPHHWTIADAVSTTEIPPALEPPQYVATSQYVR